jgi:hypothetical protein
MHSITHPRNLSNQYWFTAIKVDYTYGVVPWMCI